MTLAEKLRRQLAIQRKNQNLLIHPPGLSGTSVRENRLEFFDKVETRAGHAFSGPGQGLEAEGRQSIAHQLERLRNLQAKNFENSRDLTSDEKLRSDLGGEIRTTAAGPFLYLTELCGQVGLDPNHPESHRHNVLSLIHLLLGRQIECEPSRIAFLDTETTGLSGGTGTYAFLVGIGRWCPSGFLVEQFFMRDFHEEGALLASLEERLSEVEVVVTFNGKCFDLPLLESRFVMHHRDWPLAQRPHLDLLHPSRRLWKIRLKDCSLGSLERQVLGLERDGDVPSYLIPHLYFNYARSGVPTGLKAVLKHNRQDIKTLAQLTLTVARVLLGCASKESLAVEDLFGATRYLASLGRPRESLQFGQEALEREGPQPLRTEVLRQLAGIYRSQKMYARAAVLWQEIMAMSGTFQAEVCEDLAIYYEHRAGNLVKAVELVEYAIQQIESEGSKRSDALDPWLHRRARLQRKVGRASSANHQSKI